MDWVLASVGIAFMGLLALAYCTFRVFVAVTRLGRELERTRRRLEPKQAALTDELQALQRIRD
ncbi:hypothetical protein ACRYCC_17995 [Actinomadura scrupuli]|uniref:hypothetical protein n=1 Tax=Actinomadura scrupuli TaxID=559629 RepID=UPI003D99BB1E